MAKVIRCNNCATRNVILESDKGKQVRCYYCFEIVQEVSIDE